MPCNRSRSTIIIVTLLGDIHESWLLECSPKDSTYDRGLDNVTHKASNLGRGFRVFLGSLPPIGDSPWMLSVSGIPHLSLW